LKSEKVKKIKVKKFAIEKIRLLFHFFTFSLFCFFEQFQKTKRNQPKDYFQSHYLK